jgi:hypothetical protein
VAWLLVDNVRIVPAASVLAAVAVHELPPAEAVVQLITDVPAVHVELVVLGVTVNKVQVVLAPEYE